MTISKYVFIFLVACASAALFMPFQFKSLTILELISWNNNSSTDCDGEMAAILSRTDRHKIIEIDISRKFMRGTFETTLYPITNQEAIYLLSIYKRQFNGPDYPFYTVSREDKGIRIQPLQQTKNYAIGVDHSVFDGCGSLISDDYKKMREMLSGT